VAMNVNITNHMLCVGSLELVGVASASLLQIGDADTITLHSIFDTPPESVIIGPFAPLPEPDAIPLETATIQNIGGKTVVPINGTEEAVQPEKTRGTPVPAGSVSVSLNPTGAGKVNA
jgi:hypothetical protein